MQTMQTGIMLVNNWTEDVNDILDKIRINSIVLSNEHKKTYFMLSSRIKWFRVPVIFLSALGSVFGIGLAPYLPQLLISEICSVMSLVVGLIGSLELFLAISTKMENELVQSKELYLLAIEIQKTLLLDIENRNGDGMAYLEDKFNVYSKLIENSYLLECKIMDELTPLPSDFQSKIIVKCSNLSSGTPPMFHSQAILNNCRKIFPASPAVNDLPRPKSVKMSSSKESKRSRDDPAKEDPVLTGSRLSRRNVKSNSDPETYEKRIGQRAAAPCSLRDLQSKEGEGHSTETLHRNMGMSRRSLVRLVSSEPLPTGFHHKRNSIREPISHLPIVIPQLDWSDTPSSDEKMPDHRHIWFTPFHEKTQSCDRKPVSNSMIRCAKSDPKLYDTYSMKGISEFSESRMPSSA